MGNVKIASLNCNLWGIKACFIKQKCIYGEYSIDTSSLQFQSLAVGSASLKLKIYRQLYD